MDAVAELASRVRMSDPKPTHCAGCWRGADAEVRFVDFDAAIDRGQLIREVDGQVLQRDSIDDLHLCESCVRAGAEALALKPELHSRQLREIESLRLQVEHWRAYAKRQEETLKSRPEIEVSRRGGRR